MAGPLSGTQIDREIYKTYISGSEELAVNVSGRSLVSQAMDKITRFAST